MGERHMNWPESIAKEREKQRKRLYLSTGNTTLATGMAQTIGRLTPHDGGCSIQVTAAREVTVFYSVPSVAW